MRRTTSSAVPRPGIDLELDVERAVGGEELDVAPQCRVERRRTARRRQREDREAGFLLRERGGPLELRPDFLNG